MSNLPQVDPIDYLMRRKFRLYGQVSRFRYGDNSGLDLDGRNRLLDEMEAYENEIRALSPSARHLRVELEKKKEATTEEAARPFHRPEAAADFQFSVTLGWWSAEEAIALLLGKNPEKVTWTILEPHIGASPFAEAFRRLMQRVLRSPLAKQLSDEATPQQWIEWATDQAVAIPDSLMVAANAFKWAVDGHGELKRRVAKLEAALAEVHEALCRSQQELEAKLAAERPLGTRERDSLLQIIIAMAIDLGEYKPGVRGNLFPRITHTLELLGLPLSVDTVRRHVYAAEEILPGSWSETWATRKH